MSYDLVVFEKKNAPADAEGFLAWYQEQTQWGGDCDYNDISHASSGLQKFFHEVRKIFPPMNGALSPSNEELMNKPELEERLCDYCIGDDIIYLSLAYSVADTAYGIVKRAAYFAGVGFFATDEDSPVYFEERVPMLLAGEWFRPVKVSDFGSIREMLGGMTAKNHSYLYLTDPLGSYIQVGGFQDSFTVEKRVYTGMLSYTHRKANDSSVEKTGEKCHVAIAGNQVNVEPQQVLSGDMVEKLFQDFFEGTETVGFIKWTDMEM